MITHPLPKGVSFFYEVIVCTQSLQRRFEGNMFHREKLDIRYDVSTDLFVFNTLFSGGFETTFEYLLFWRQDTPGGPGYGFSFCLQVLPFSRFIATLLSLLQHIFLFTYHIVLQWFVRYLNNSKGG
jgi:hypothetical protein